MFRLYSKGCEYAIRALAHLPASAEDGRFQATELFERAGIPVAFTRKVFQALVQGGFLEAVRGPGGGYALVKPPADITLLEIIQAVDGENTFEGCILGLDKCDSEEPCPLHHVWDTAKNEMLSQLRSRTLADLIEAVRRRGREGQSPIPGSDFLSMIEGS